MNTKGLTLLELIIAISVFVLATFAVSTFIIQSFRAQNFSLEQSSAINEARRGVETMIKELREALPSDTGSYPIELADDQELIFYADFDRDDAVEKVRYWLDGTDFKKNIIEASGTPLSYSGNGETEVLSRFVRNNTNTIFIYYNSDYVTSTAPADPSNVKLIHINLKINVNPQKAPLHFELESDVSLRNLKENL